ncbi:MAG: hypothetical protein PF541_02505 [Prolixibacteraceae bacterium]|jgi:hypothetical protein|nr:hypothetical protein [Prolixibacteraceae bacterium]
MIKSLSILLLFFSIISFAQKKNVVQVDKNGTMRWPNNTEVKGFGVNYTVPFAHGYRFAKNSGIDPKKAIENDVYHFSRLGFDLFRVHVWDTEICDTLGNLIENEHLDAFDFLLNELKQKGINSVITPIAFWGNGWPEKDEPTPGFSYKYGKANCLTNPDAIAAQQNYLAQFLDHVNPYTGIAYKNDPSIIAFEVSNEPHHRGDAKEVTEFIKGMLKAMRKTGLQKPIFYNISHAVHLADAYFEAGIQGGTFQWYPTGLTSQKEIPGNLIPNVNKYNIPFDESIQKHHGAKLVYEFDAADVNKSYIYPIIARSFREAGIQIATHFAYDPTFSAHANTEYNTHYMNLAYTPQNALSLMISAEVFHQIPMNQSQGEYPANLEFQNFKISYPNDLAEYNAENKFIYTNHTESKPVNEEKLTTIAGFGNSPLIKYNGTGAYFLDKIEDGIWRLELMPDAILVDNPFGKNSPKKTITVINWKEHEMKIQLENLGDDFSIETINEGNNTEAKVDKTTFGIQPGTYILSKKGVSKNWTINSSWKNIQLNDFFAPKSSVTKPWLKHNQKIEISENSPFKIEVQFVSPKEIEEIQLFIQAGFRRKSISFEAESAYNYSAIIPAELVKAGLLNYTITVKFVDDSSITYPAAEEGLPYDWDFYNTSTYSVRVVPKTFPIHLFDATTDASQLAIQWRPGFKLVPTKEANRSEYQMNIPALFVEDAENLNAAPIYDYSFKHFIIDKIEGRKEDLPSMKSIVFKGRALNNKACKLQIALVLNNGVSYGKTILLNENTNEYNINLSELEMVKTVTLPRPYPSFLPYYFEHNIHNDFDITKVESIQFSIGPEIPENELNDHHGVSIESVRFE